MKSIGLRAGEVTEAFLAKLHAESPNGFERAREPDFQQALFTVQREYALTGDKQLGDLLVELLVDRSKQPLRDILQIVLTESLSTAPKLTDSQLAALSVVFMFRYAIHEGVGDQSMLGAFLDNHVAPFIPKLVKNQACYQHLEFTGCGSISIANIPLHTAVRNVYQGLFSIGFDETEVSTRGLSTGLDPRVFMRCLNDPSKFQVRALNKELLTRQLESQAINVEDRARIVELFDSSTMSDEDLIKTCTALRPYMGDLFEVWSASAMGNFNLTSVGIAIGHANVKRLVGEFAQLSIWIN